METHRGYDQKGRQVPLSRAWEIIVSREAEWDDAERESLLALAIYEAGVCECGTHASLADDPENYFTFETRVCPNCREIARWTRLQDHKDERVRKGLNTQNPMTPDPADGRHTYLRQMSPSEIVAHQAPREEPSLGGPRRVGPAHS